MVHPPEPAAAAAPSAPAIAARLDQLQRSLDSIERPLARPQMPSRESFTQAELAELVRLSADTVRDHICRGRITATRARSGRGATLGWRVSREELRRYQAERLLPERSRLTTAHVERATDEPQAHSRHGDVRHPRPGR